VQHHHAHLAACLAEHGESGLAVGAIYDGSGWGADGSVWGGELLAGDLMGFERAGMLFAVRLPGGDAAVREPWRMACAWLAAALERDVPPLPRSLRGDVDPRRWESVAELARTGVAAPLTTSAGRLFDAVAALAGVRATVVYEGQAAAELESAAAVDVRDAYPMPLVDGHDAGLAPGTVVLDARETVRAIAGDLDSGRDAADVAARFHNSLADATAEACAVAAERIGTEIAVLSGGVFQNRRLLDRASTRLRSAGLRTLVPSRLPPNDGGVSYGQAAVAAARLRGGGG
jgi:hydrogenase maturation protein HypF